MLKLLPFSSVNKVIGLSAGMHLEYRIYIAWADKQKIIGQLQARIMILYSIKTSVEAM